MRPLLVLRPEPGASATARRARALGLAPVVSPLFTVRAIAWDPPDASTFDTVLFTSANAPRHAGAGLARYRHLPCLAVGDATANSARDAGFGDVTAGTHDAERLLAAIAPDTRVLHLCGEHRHAAARPTTQIPVYVSQAAETLAAVAREATAAGAVAMLHSPRAAAVLCSLLPRPSRANVAIVAISPAAADAAGSGWATVAAAPRPADAAMLAIARLLCENDAR